LNKKEARDGGRSSKKRAGERIAKQLGATTKPTTSGDEDALITQVKANI
jgi:hypothetical protein